MYAPILRNPAGDMRLPVLELVEAIEQNMPAELAAAQRRTGQRSQLGERPEASRA